MEDIVVSGCQQLVGDVIWRRRDVVVVCLCSLLKLYQSG